MIEIAILLAAWWIAQLNLISKTRVDTNKPNHELLKSQPCIMTTDLCNNIFAANRAGNSKRVGLSIFIKQVNLDDIASFKIENDGLYMIKVIDVCRCGKRETPSVWHCWALVDKNMYLKGQLE